jgi:hypothetical protein
MSDKRDGYVSTDWRGVATTYKMNSDGDLTVTTAQDVEPILELNKAQYNETVHKSPNGEMWHAARIPPVVQLKWLLEDGIDVFDPEHARKVAQKLNSSDWRHLRTGHFQL